MTRDSDTREYFLVTLQDDIFLSSDILSCKGISVSVTATKVQWCSSQGIGESVILT